MHLLYNNQRSVPPSEVIGYKRLCLIIAHQPIYCCVNGTVSLQRLFSPSLRSVLDLLCFSLGYL